MNRLLIVLAVLAAFLWSPEAEAVCATQTFVDSGTHALWTNDCTDDNEVLIQTTDVSRFDACFLMSTTGAVDVFVSLDGTNYATAALSLEDKGATSTAPVLVTAALRVYGFVAKFRRIRVIQNGATDAAASLLCWIDD